MIPSLSSPINLIAIDTSKYPKTIEECWKLIYRLDRDNTQLRSKNSDYGVASKILREKKNFTIIDDVIERSMNIPFTFNDFFDKWKKETDEVSELPSKIINDLKKHMKDLLLKNGIIRKVGSHGTSHLYRVNGGYNFILRKSSELVWRANGQDEGTFLIPKLETT